MEHQEHGHKVPVLEGRPSNISWHDATESLFCSSHHYLNETCFSVFLSSHPFMDMLDIVNVALEPDRMIDQGRRKEEALSNT